MHRYDNIQSVLGRRRPRTEFGILKKQCSFALHANRGGNYHLACDANADLVPFYVKSTWYAVSSHRIVYSVYGKIKLYTIILISSDTHPKPTAY